MPPSNILFEIHKNQSHCTYVRSHTCILLHRTLHQLSAHHTDDTQIFMGEVFCLGIDKDKGKGSPAVCFTIFSGSSEVIFIELFQLWSLRIGSHVTFFESQIDKSFDLFFASHCFSFCEEFVWRESYLELQYFYFSARWKGRGIIQGLRSDHVHQLWLYLEVQWWPPFIVLAFDTKGAWWNILYVQYPYSIT